MSVCYLIGAGAFTVRGLYPEDGDFVIAADGGYTLLTAEGIVPDLLVGDFDSLKYIPKDIPRITFLPEKDETDLALALKEGAARGYHTFRIYGAYGGRDDHSYANLQLLGGASKQGMDCKIVSPSCEIYSVTNGTLELPVLRKGTVVSVFCHGDSASGVTLKGLKYPLDGAVLTGDMPLGVSNEATGAYASVTVDSGTLLVFVMLKV